MEQISMFNENRKAKWRNQKEDGTPMMRCSACGGGVFKMPYTYAVWQDGFRFCPYCGAQMSNPNQKGDEWYWGAPYKVLWIEPKTGDVHERDDK